MNTRGNVFILLCLTFILSGCGGGGGTSTPTYTARTMQPEKDYVVSEAWFIDNNGRVFGAEAQELGTTGMCVWEPGSNRPTQLHIPDEVSYCIMQRISIGGHYQRISNNDRIAYVGEMSAGVADLVTGQTMALEPLPGSGYALPVDVNDAGVCAGMCHPGSDRGDPAIPTVWNAAGHPTELQVPENCSGTVAAISNAGQVLGTVGSYTVTPHAVVWNPNGSVARDIPIPEEANANGVSGLMISDSGYVIVRSSFFIFYLVSPAGNIVPLYDPDNPFGGGISAMNAHGQVLGHNGSGSPVIWSPDGLMIKLPLPFAGALCTVYDINDSGVVVGIAERPDHTNRSAVIWTLAN